VTRDPRAVRLLIETAGAQRLVLGMGCPFDMAELEPIARLAAVPGLSPDGRERILSRNALELLGELKN
jgi:hypothetical protein